MFLTWSLRRRRRLVCCDAVNNKGERVVEFRIKATTPLTRPHKRSSWSYPVARRFDYKEVETISQRICDSWESITSHDPSIDLAQAESEMSFVAKKRTRTSNDRRQVTLNQSDFKSWEKQACEYGQLFFLFWQLCFYCEIGMILQHKENVDDSTHLNHTPLMLSEKIQVHILVLTRPAKAINGISASV